MISGSARRQDAAIWLQKSRLWSSSASQAVTAPPLQLLPSAPLLTNPAWAWAPSFAAAAALLVPPCTQKGGEPSEADLDAAVRLARGAGCVGRVLWAAGLRDAFFAVATPYPHLEGVNHSQRQLLPIVEKIVSQQDAQQQQQQQQAGGAGGGRRRLQALFREIAADQRARGLRFLGWVLSHLFRWLFNSELFVDVAALERLRALRLGPQPQRPQQEQQTQQQPAGGAPAALAPSGSTAAAAVAPPSSSTAALVFVPAHKSHLDYLMLSYVLFAAGLPCPHIAAGANLSLPLVGRLLRACGAFFIRRSTRGSPDAAHYKAVLAAYVQALLAEGHSLEFFIEGGRSRDGRVNPPKLGLLKMVVDAVASGDVHRPVLLVPTAMNYDAAPAGEERGLAAQLAGRPKQRESLGGLARTCWAVLAKALRARSRPPTLGSGGTCGRATLAFGQPLSLQAWLADNAAAMAAGGGAQRRAIAELGERLAAGIRTANVVPTSALLVGALFAARHGCTGPWASADAPPQAAAAGEPLLPAQCNGVDSGDGLAEAVPADAVAAGMDWLAAELAERGASAVRLAGSPDAGERQQQLLRLAGLMLHCCGVRPACKGGSGRCEGSEGPPALRLLPGVEAALLQHSRLNQLLPWLAAEGLVAAAAAAAEADGQPGAGETAVLETAAWLRRLLAPEVDTAVGPSALAEPAAFQHALQRLLRVGALERAEGGRLRLVPGTRGAAAAAARLAAALLAPLLATYLQVLRCLQAALGGGQAGSDKALSAAALQQLVEAAGGGGRPDACQPCGVAAAAAAAVPSMALVQGALRSFAALGVLAPADPDGLACAAAEAAAALQPPVPKLRSCSSSSLNAAAGDEGGCNGVAAAASSSGPQHRRSFERRRRPAEGGAASSSDSEQDAAVADSVAANLCSLDSGRSGEPGSPADAKQSAGATAETGAAAGAAGVPAGAPRWVLAQPPAAVEQLADKILSFIMLGAA